ncbi:ABC transporter permease [Parapedobacter koreensis]|uniref:Putative ABC transport system permease protein n=1 Tax=Parapedobacter koreensis TaxID=332977 RepID=A0A1H7NU63_9SPHI|nr:ABC transporter permease [Parapedobacter koreensis]SEL26525.1 putative ABC transport system permease protein [Parapedobacter koreensis]
MLRNYLKIAWRNLKKNKLYSLINMTGLATGMAVCIVIMLFVSYERSFDGFHTKNIYRLNEVQKFEGMVAPQNVALSMFPMGPTLQQEFPEVINFTRVRPNGKLPLQFGEKRVTLAHSAWADSTFFELFDFQLVSGDRTTALHEPNSLVLTERSAQLLFGADDALGKTIAHYGQDTLLLTVTGILENMPANSHLQFDGLISFNTFADPRLMGNWGGNWLTTYLELAAGTDIAALEKKFPAYLQAHMNEEQAKAYELFLQPLQDVHARSADITHDYLNHAKFDGNYTSIFSFIAIIVLVIAAINFVNLSSAKAASRAKEIGVRKAAGAKRPQLYLQFIGESVLLSFLALLLSLAFVALLLPYVNQLSQRQIGMPLWSRPGFLLLVAAGTVVVGILSGLYPAAYLSSFQPTKVLKGSPETGRKKFGFRNVLVVVQFSSAIFLIIATLFATQQLRYMQRSDPGFTREQIVTVPLDDKSYPKYEALKQQLLSNALITQVTASQQRLGNNLHQTGVRFHGEGPVRELASSQIIVDPDFLNVYQIQLIAGRDFHQDYASDNGKAFIINETLAKELLKDYPGKPVESLLGRHFGFGGVDSTAQIVGIAKDFNFNSLHHKIETLCLFNQRDWGFSELSVKINGARASDAIAHIQSTWNKLVPERDFEYQFLDDHFAELYRSDSTVSEIVGILTALSIFISCLGLFGLASFTAEQRVKEIGIRKVLGASVGSIVRLLSTGFVKLVLVAILIAVPLAWWAVSTWLQNFAYRIDIAWWIFAGAGLLAIIIALLTVSGQAIRAALANPVDSLRDE